jgi:LPXTG-motif cell wall-anchored protein
MRKFASKVVLAVLALALVSGFITTMASTEIAVNLVLSDDPAQQRNLVVPAELLQSYTYLLIEHTREDWGNTFVFLTDPGWHSLENSVTHRPGLVVVNLTAQHGAYDEGYPAAVRLAHWGGWEEGAVTRVVLSNSSTLPAPPAGGVAAVVNPATGADFSSTWLVVSGIGLLAAMGALAGALVFKKRK